MRKGIIIFVIIIAVLTFMKLNNSQQAVQATPSQEHSLGRVEEAKKVDGLNGVSTKPDKNTLQHNTEGTSIKGAIGITIGEDYDPNKKK
ncbi:MAG: hypothetical protein AB7E47_15745 [Desulfovibrionaceae bacterium]